MQEFVTMSHRYMMCLKKAQWYVRLPDVGTMFRPCESIGRQDHNSAKPFSEGRREWPAFTLRWFRQNKKDTVYQ